MNSWSRDVEYYLQGYGIAVTEENGHTYATDVVGGTGKHVVPPVLSSKHAADSVLKRILATRAGITSITYTGPTPTVPVGQGAIVASVPPMPMFGVPAGEYQLWNPDTPKCKHEWVNVGFMSIKNVCKHCDVDQEKI